MSRKDRVKWQPFKTAPKDGTELIFWVSSQKGFEDITANFYFNKGKWWWAGTEDVLKRPDLVNGWMFYPQPPVKTPNKKTIAAMGKAAITSRKHPPALVHS